MLTNKIHIMWLKLQREDKHFRLSFPVPLYIFKELLDCILDLLELACFLVPKKKQKDNSQFSVYGAKIITQMGINLLDTLADGEPYNFFDVKTNKISVSAKIR